MPDRGRRPDRISPFAKLVGLSFPESSGHQCEMEIEEKVLNVYGTVHGGAISTLADVSMGYALFDHLREDERLATVEMKINYVAAVSSGVLTAEARLVDRTRNLAVLESRVECGGKLVAKAMGTFYISKKPSKQNM
jgi:acyl-CoA thioesterase